MITIAELLSQQVRDTHGTLIAITQDLDQPQVQWQPPGTANPIAGTWAHAIITEDIITNQVIRNSDPFAVSTWENQTGLSAMPPGLGEDNVTNYQTWVSEVMMELDQFRNYMQAVFVESETLLSKLSEKELSQEVDASIVGMDSRPVYSVVYNGLISHTENISGEISALKGIQGLQGYPW